jgi:hypothetical protein
MKTMKLKNESTIGFLKEFSLVRNYNEVHLHAGSIFPSRETLRKTCGLKPGDEIEMEIDEAGNKTGEEVNTTIVYSVCEHDDYSVEIVRQEAKK